MSSSSTTAAIAGASGLVGSCLLRRLLDDPGYGRVVSFVRKPLPISHPKLEQVEVTVDNLPGALADTAADDWYCALGTTIRTAGTREAFRRVDYDYPMALGRQAAASGGKRFLLVSAVGASASSSIFYSRVKGELERDLEKLGIPELHVFRPSLLLGERQEYRRGERFFGYAMKPLNPLLAGPLAKYKAVQADSVAAAMVRAARSDAAAGMHLYEGKRLFGKQ